MKIKSYTFVSAMLLISAVSNLAVSKDYVFSIVLVGLAGVTYFLVKSIFKKYVGDSG